MVVLFGDDGITTTFRFKVSENSDTLKLKVVGIPSSPKRTTTKKINLCNYDENDVADQDKGEVDYDGEVGPILDAISYEMEFDNDRDNPVSMEGKGYNEVKDQSGRFVKLSNRDIDATKKYKFYADRLQRGGE